MIIIKGEVGGISFKILEKNIYKNSSPLQKKVLGHLTKYIPPAPFQLK